MIECWMLPNGKCLYEPPEGFYGYIYLIEGYGKCYIGKKAFLHRKKTKLSKKARIGTRKRVKVEQIDSKWLDYWGSCKPLLEEIKEKGTKNYKRTILKFCKTRQDLAYWEVHFLITQEVLFKDNFWNANILNRFYKHKINE